MFHPSTSSNTHMRGYHCATAKIFPFFVFKIPQRSAPYSGSVNEKSILMATYALCGFANFSSIAIQIGGLGPLAPNRKSDIAALGIKAVIGGVLTTLLTATLAGLFFSF